MALKIILCVQHFCSFGAMLFVVCSDFSQLGCLWELIIAETHCNVFDLKRYGK